MELLFENVACVRCGRLCDDLKVQVRDGRVVDVEGACPMARPWWKQPPGDLGESAATVDGRSAALDEAIARAVGVLQSADFPLITGSAAGVASWRAAVSLAKRTGAVVDPFAAPGETAFLLAVQEVGLAACSLGEIQNRADLLVFWRCDPTVTHPRLLDRCRRRDGTVEATTVVAAGPPDCNCDWADETVTLPVGSDLAAVAELRERLRKIGSTARQAKSSRHTPCADNRMSVEKNDQEVGSSQPGGTAGQAKSGTQQDTDGTAGQASSGTPTKNVLTDLVNRMSQCGYGVLFFGPEIGESPGGRRTIEGLLRLVDELNAPAGRSTPAFWETPVGRSRCSTGRPVFSRAVDFAGGEPRLPARKTARQRYYWSEARRMRA